MTDLRLLLSSVASLGMLLAVPASAVAASCESLASLSLPNITVTAAQTIPAGDYTAANGQTFSNLPTFCRVAATATPTSQSDINFEVWMPPTGTWNGIFRGEGSGGISGCYYVPADGKCHSAELCNDVQRQRAYRQQLVVLASA